MSETEHIVSDEEVSAMERNKFEKDKNRTGADVPGSHVFSSGLMNRHN